MLAVIGGSAIGMTSLVFYVLVYMAANLAVFGIISTVEQHSGGQGRVADTTDSTAPIQGWRWLMTLALFSLAGIPPLPGSFRSSSSLPRHSRAVSTCWCSSRWSLRWFPLYYYLLVVKAMYITPNEEPIAPLRSDRYTRLSLALCMAGILLLGVFSVVFLRQYQRIPRSGFNRTGMGRGALALASAPLLYSRAVFRGAFGNVHSEVGKFAARLPVCRAKRFFQPLGFRSRPSR